MVINKLFVGEIGKERGFKAAIFANLLCFVGRS